MNKMSISPSTLSVIESCLRLYKYSKIDRFGPKPGDRSKYMDKGDFMHKVLEAHYKLKQHKEDGIVGKTIEIARKLAIAHKLPIEETENCIRAYQEYALRWASDNWEIEFVEKPFNIPILKTDKTEFFIEGKIDLGINVQKKFFPVDHKTGQKMNEIHPLNHQFICYCYATDTQSIMINRVVWTKEVQFAREIKSFDRAVIEEWKEHVIYICQVLELAAEHNHYPPNYSSCWNCSFNDVCASRPDIRDFKLNRDFIKTEPYDLFKK